LLTGFILFRREENVSGKVRILAAGGNEQEETEGTEGKNGGFEQKKANVAKRQQSRLKKKRS
jgi:hypothetical protein